ncbi:DUF4097 family beta strand repeat-containing protein [Rummeliibacillus pycnus]|uniref:DUF4097 family beta strand repeat-containing protein n=1 Tax=Rummeliibacillus pycnus TaxID=101070 RepID=UPI0037C8BB82
MFGFSELTDRKKVCYKDTISDISLDWITGDIHILQSENDEIKIVQITNEKFPEHHLFHHKVNSGKLYISDGRKKKIKIGFNINITNLEIHLPKRQLHSISIDCTGGNLIIDDLDAITCNCNITSGNAKFSGTMEELTIRATGCKITGEYLDIKKLHLKTTSTKIDFSGKFSEVNVNSTGRSIMVSSSTMLQKIKSISTAANVKVSIPENDGFSFHFKKLSGNFKSDFSLIMAKDSYVYKNGTSMFDAEVRGGFFTLCKV